VVLGQKKNLKIDYLFVLRITDFQVYGSRKFMDPVRLSKFYIINVHFPLTTVNIIFEFLKRNYCLQVQVARVSFISIKVKQRDYIPYNKIRGSFISTRSFGTRIDLKKSDHRSDRLLIQFSNPNAYISMFLYMKHVSLKYTGKTNKIQSRNFISLTLINSYKIIPAVFLYTTNQADVIQVNESAFNRCDATNPISNYSKGRSYAFQLNESRHYYFICSLGYCYNGMKLAVTVHPLPPPSPPPSSSLNVSLAIARASMGSFVAAAVIAVVMLLFLVP
jgi:Plastocyanin-like domain